MNDAAIQKYRELSGQVEDLDTTLKSVEAVKTAIARAH